MMTRTILAAGLAAAVLSSAASAQTVGIGTMRAGASMAVSGTIASIVSKHSGFQMRTQAFAGIQQYIPAVNAGKIEFGSANVPQLRFAISGTGLSEGRPHPDLRMVATLMPFRVGMLVQDSAPIKTLTDLKGKRLAGGVTPTPLIDHLTLAILRNGGLTYGDVTVVPASGFPDLWNQFGQKRLDGAIMAVGTGVAMELVTQLGKLRYLDLSDDPAAVERMQAAMPGSYVMEVPRMDFPGLASATRLMAFDYTFFTSRHVPDETVYRAAKAMHENEQEVRDATPHWRAFRAKNMAKQVEITYHPGAIRFYKEVGIWTGS